MLEDFIEDAHPSFESLSVISVRLTGFQFRWQLTAVL